ncbi:MAG TPA: biotin/lipoyl-containing protein, partial [Candidatus Limnocylindrales bacterium]|nr:biotin/lipoyl-containing protein [Candidatus Limnocylindrales bacterium]
VLAAGLAWVGPPPEATRALGDKAAARRLAARLGVPTLPGYEGRGQSDAVLRREAARVGYPLLLKPSAGGGGKGMHVVRAAGDLAEALARARREAGAAFGDDRLVIERYLDRPRHVEVQLLLDAHGHGIHLGERDCSLQRRHQKVIEEAPAPGVAPALREALGEAALRLAREAGYVGAGTAEFLLDDAGSFFFLELNARLQVEHPVTEAVTGLDLVEQQLRVARGEPLDISQADVALRGHAVEARLYAEDPWSGFLPATGRVVEVAWPGGEGLRVDAGVGPGDEVGTRYDPLLAKLIAHGTDRASALDRLAAALEATRLLGVTTNRGFLRALLEVPEIRAGDARTDTIAVRWHPDPAPVPEAAWKAGATALLTALAMDGARPGFRLNAPPRLRLRIGEEERSVAVPPEAPAEGRWARAGDGAVVLDLDGRAVRVALAPPPTVESAVAHAAGAAGGSDTVRAPMPGVVLAVRVEAGQAVEATQTLVVLEAMKMENNVPAPADARVARVLVRPGQPVQKGEPLVELA